MDVIGSSLVGPTLSIRACSGEGVRADSIPDAASLWGAVAFVIDRALGGGSGAVVVDGPRLRASGSFV